ncbi:unnamed protein product [Rangifer tarandus platyrhynchus]|uniref:Uncharacterized protein n=1 Tax=Rangifer tarandus platyrhynchus TaxID=3082113 RepID=A0ACB1MK21_RANTA
MLVPRAPFPRPLPTLPYTQCSPASRNLVPGPTSHMVSWASLLSSPCSLIPGTGDSSACCIFCTHMPSLKGKYIFIEEIKSKMTFRNDESTTFRNSWEESDVREDVE